MKKLTTVEFIDKANNIHDNKYTYTNTIYNGALVKVIITCPTHGDFEQLANNHLCGRGCPECNLGIQPKAKEIFIEEANKVHKSKYKYILDQYKNTKTNITIVCSIHGEFEQTPANHLKGQGCPACGKLEQIKKQTFTTKIFIENATKIHGTKYDYSKVNYLRAKSKVSIICPMHGEFLQSHDTHITQKQGCPGCAKHGFDPTKPGILYYLRITTDEGIVLYKIGITNRSVNERFRLTDLSKIEIVKQRVYTNGQEAYNKEQEILKKYSKYKYKGPNILESGNTELFTIDIQKAVL